MNLVGRHGVDYRSSIPSYRPQAADVLGGSTPPPGVVKRGPASRHDPADVPRASPLMLASARKTSPAQHHPGTAAGRRGGTTDASLPAVVKSRRSGPRCQDSALAGRARCPAREARPSPGDRDDFDPLSIAARFHPPRALRRRPAVAAIVASGLSPRAAAACGCAFSSSNPPADRSRSAVAGSMTADIVGEGHQHLALRRLEDDHRGPLHPSTRCNRTAVEPARRTGTVSTRNRPDRSRQQPGSSRPVRAAIHSPAPLASRPRPSRRPRTAPAAVPLPADVSIA